MRFRASYIRRTRVRFGKYNAFSDECARNSLLYGGVNAKFSFVQ